MNEQEDENNEEQKLNEWWTKLMMNENNFCREYNLKGVSQMKLGSFKYFSGLFLECGGGGLHHFKTCVKQLKTMYSK